MVLNSLRLLKTYIIRQTVANINK